jgi:hypothetical protein
MLHFAIHVSLCRMLKRVGFRSALWSGQNLPFDVWPEIIGCWGVGDIHGNLYSTCRMWFPCVSTRLSALCYTKMHTVENFWFHWNLPTGILYLPVTVSHWSVLNMAQLSVQVLSKSVEKMRLCPLMNEPHALSLMKRHLFQE